MMCGMMDRFMPLHTKLPIRSGAKLVITKAGLMSVIITDRRGFDDAAGMGLSDPDTICGSEQAAPVSTSIIQLMPLPAKGSAAHQTMYSVLARQKEVFMACGVPCNDPIGLNTSLHGSIRDLQDEVGNAGVRPLCQISSGILAACVHPNSCSC